MAFTYESCSIIRPSSFSSLIVEMIELPRELNWFQIQVSTLSSLSASVILLSTSFRWSTKSFYFLAQSATGLDERCIRYFFSNHPRSPSPTTATLGKVLVQPPGQKTCPLAIAISYERGVYIENRLHDGPRLPLGARLERATVYEPIQ